MGTTFYMMTEDKEVIKRYFDDMYELTDTPHWGYSVRIAKISGGWKPLFRAYKNMRSVEQLKAIYATGEFVIYDEYGVTYDWNAFSAKVLHFADDNPDAFGHLFPPKTDSNANVRGVPITDVYGYNFPYKDFYADSDGFEFVDR